MNLPPLTQAFVLHFGEMGGRWGINRTVGQIYALLFLSERPLNADEITDSLGISRSNVSMGIKELEGWRLVKKRHLPGDRRDYLEAPDDIWQIVRTLAEERRKREIDPTMSLLRDVLMENPQSDEERFAQDRMRQMHDMIELLLGWADDVQKLGNPELMRLLALGAGVSKLLDAKNKIVNFAKSRKDAEEKLVMDALILARAQFGFTVAVHIIFPVFSIGLASYLAVLETLWLKTGRDVYLQLFKYWLKIFATGFAAGVVSGLVMSYQFGTNWSVFSDKAGPVIGPLMAYEVLSAFFLEAGFLGVMLFGLERVGKRLHYSATLAVAAGTFMSAFWILSANSWMQTPAGYAINEAGQFIPADWLAVIFNPSFPFRLVHMVLAAYLTTALAVGAVGAFHLLRDRTNPASRIMFSMAMGMIVVVAPLQIFAGDAHGLNTLEHQPVKVLAMEGHFQAHPEGAPLILFGLPNQAESRVDYAIEIPKMSSLILKHDPNAALPGLEDFPREDWPPVPIIFWSFRLMVGLGFAMLALGASALFARIKGSLYDCKWLHRGAVAMGPAGFAAVICGWVTTEVGRQPFTVFGLLRTDHSVSPLAAPAVATSLAAFALVYFTVFSAGVFYMVRLMGHAPHPGESGPETLGPIRTASQTQITEEGL